MSIRLPEQEQVEQLNGTYSTVLTHAEDEFHPRQMSVRFPYEHVKEQNGELVITVKPIGGREGMLQSFATLRALLNEAGFIQT